MTTLRLASIPIRASLNTDHLRKYPMLLEALSARLHSNILALFVLAVTAVTPIARSDENDSGKPTAGPLPETQFVNPIAEGADPWVTRDERSLKYYWCMSEGNRAIAVHASDSITSLGPKQIVWRAPNEGPFSREVWAPELHQIDNRWFIYFAASDGQNKNHRAYVLASRTTDPLGEYDLHGPLVTGDSADRTGNTADAHLRQQRFPVGVYRGKRKGTRTERGASSSQVGRTNVCHVFMWWLVATNLSSWDARTDRRKSTRSEGMEKVPRACFPKHDRNLWRRALVLCPVTRRS